MGVLVPGDGRVRFCQAPISGLEFGDWVAIDGLLGQEPAQVVFESRRVELSGDLSSRFTLSRRLTSDEIDRVESRAERAQSLRDLARDGIDRVDPQATLASLRFTLDGSTVLILCFGTDPEPPEALVESLAVAIGYAVRVEWIGRPARVFGGLGRIRSGRADDWDVIRDRLEIDDLAAERFPHRWPRLGSVVQTPGGPGRLISISVRHNVAIIRLPGGEEVEVPVEDLTALP